MNAEKDGCYERIQELAVMVERLEEERDAFRDALREAWLRIDDISADVRRLTIERDGLLAELGKRPAMRKA